MTALFLVLLCVAGIDEDLREDIRYGWQGPVQDAVARTLDAGLQWQPVVAAELLMWSFGDDRLHGTAEPAMVAHAVGTGLLMGTRALVDRRRPEADDTDWWESAFPSGHTLTYFSLATVFAARYPELRWPLAAGGVVVGLSRIYLGEHYPSDVLAGAALGTGAGLLVAALWPRDGLECLRWGRHPVVPAIGCRASGTGAGVALRF